MPTARIQSSAAMPGYAALTMVVIGVVTGLVAALSTGFSGFFLWIVWAAFVAPFSLVGVVQGAAWRWKYGRVRIDLHPDHLEVRHQDGTLTTVGRHEIYLTQVVGRFGVRSILTAQGMGTFPKVRIKTSSGIVDVELMVWRDEARIAERTLRRWRLKLNPGPTGADSPGGRHL